MNLPDNTTDQTDDQRPIVLFDGECGVCSRSIRFILSHEAGPTLRFASLQSASGQALLQHHGLVGQDTMVYIADGQAAIRSSAVLAIVGHLRAPWRWLAIGNWVPRILRDGIYRLIAKQRRNLGLQVCTVPTLQQRERFLS